MKITRLQVADLRAFEQAEFEFNSRMNLLVGVNGVGKTTVLDCLRICLSKLLPVVTASRSHPLPFTRDDIRVGSAAATVRLSFRFGGKDFELSVHKPRETRVVRKPGKADDHVVETPDKEKCTPELTVLGEEVRTAEKQPLGIFFSTRRSLVSDVGPSKTSSKGGQSTAFADALGSREFRLVEMADWMRAQESLGSRASHGDEAPCGASPRRQEVPTRLQEPTG